MVSELNGAPSGGAPTEAGDAGAAVTESEIAELALDAHALVVITDPPGNIIHANENFCRASKYSREELLGLSHQDLGISYHEPDAYERIQESVLQGNVWQGELSSHTRFGSTLRLATTVVPVFHSDGSLKEVLTIQTDITEQHRIQEEALHRAFNDPLTGLPNRQSMYRELDTISATAPAQARYGSLITVSLEGFASVNFALGFAKGDELLRQCATRLLSVSGRIRHVARIGTSVFALLVSDISGDLAEAERVTQQLGRRVRTELQVQFWLGGEITVDVTPNVGAVVFDAFEESSEEILKKAELARVESKLADGDADITIFSDAFLEASEHRLELITELRRGIRKNELVLFYQPIVNLDEVTVGFEALVRWESPTRGLVPPDEFIPIAEQTGLIGDISTWVLEQAAHQLEDWRKNDPGRRFSLSVNLSEREMRRPDFVERTRAILDAHDIEECRLTFEITESLAQSNLDDAVAKLRDLQRGGMRFSLDDFGTGFSSMGLLQHLPIQQLKVDRVFTANVHTDHAQRAIVQSIVTLAKTYGLEVVAEGIETREQFEALKQMEIDLFQGFYFGRPRPMREHRALPVRSGASER